MDRNRGHAASEEVVVPVVAEEIEIGRAVSETERVRVEKTVHTREQVVEAPATRELVDVERVPVGRLVDEPPRVRVEGDTTVIPVLEEVLVVEKRLVIKEEIRIRKRRVTETRQVRVPLRAEHVEMERTSPDNTKGKKKADP